MTDPRMERLQERREKMRGQQVDNGALPVGSPMYYYCHSCGVLVATLPEDWYKEPPPKHCDDCKPLIEEGLIDSTDTFKSWERAQKEATA